MFSELGLLEGIHGEEGGRCWPGSPCVRACVLLSMSFLTASGSTGCLYLPLLASTSALLSIMAGTMHFQEPVHYQDYLALEKPWLWLIDWKTLAMSRMTSVSVWQKQAPDSVHLCLIQGHQPANPCLVTYFELGVMRGGAAGLFCWYCWIYLLQEPSSRYPGSTHSALLVFSITFLMTRKMAFLVASDNPG